MRNRRSPSLARVSFSSERRGHRRRGHVAVVLALLVAVVVGVLLLGTSAPGGPRGPGSRAGQASAHPGPGRPATPARPRPDELRAAVAAEDHAVDRVLRYTPFVASGTAHRRVMALTFDDGPSPYTEAIVGVLTRLRVPATFFVVGQQLRYFSAGVHDELRHGFLVGDHTLNHAWLARLPPAGQALQIGAGAAVLRRAGAPSPRLFRPPYGAYGPATLSILRRLGMLMVLWSIDPGDWRRPGTGAIVSGVLRNAHPGAIVILHDGGGDRSQTIAALAPIVRGLRRRGFTLVSVPRLLALDPPPRHQKLPQLGAA